MGDELHASVGEFHLRFDDLQSRNKQMWEELHAKVGKYISRFEALRSTDKQLWHELHAWGGEFEKSMTEECFKTFRGYSLKFDDHSKQVDKD